LARYRASQPERAVHVRIGINVGEPVEEGGDLFGATVQLAARMCEHAGADEILVPSSLPTLVAGKDFTFLPATEVTLRGIGRVEAQRVRWSEAADAESAAALPDVAPTRREPMFRREGEYWTVGYGGVVSRFRDAKGFRYLSRLLGMPGREVHVLDLAGVGIGVAGAGDAGAVLDEQAKAAYRQRVEDLREEIDEATADNDGERASRAREELDTLLDALRAAVGLGGRDRRAAATAERARQSVQRAMKSALSKIEEANPGLGRHLAQTVRTGTFCSYMPDERAGIRWET
jgi:hypothetical protein